jgi:hypothetical protein
MLTLLLALLAATPATTPQQKPDVAEKAADSRDKIVCKRFIKTGSLIGTERTCKTKWEWERERENARQQSGSSACGLAGNGGQC